jgi:hypothetical protein
LGLLMEMTDNGGLNLANQAIGGTGEQQAKSSEESVNERLMNLNPSCLPCHNPRQRWIRYTPYAIRYTCRAASTNPPFLKKRTQFYAFSAPKPRFGRKTNPKRTQNEPNRTQFPLVFAPKMDIRQKTNPKRTQSAPMSAGHKT